MKCGQRPASETSQEGRKNHAFATWNSTTKRTQPEHQKSTKGFVFVQSRNPSSIKLYRKLCSGSHLLLRPTQGCHHKTMWRYPSIEDQPEPAELTHRQTRLCSNCSAGECQPAGQLECATVCKDDPTIADTYQSAPQNVYAKTKFRSGESFLCSPQTWQKPRQRLGGLPATMPGCTEAGQLAARVRHHEQKAPLNPHGLPQRSSINASIGTGMDQLLRHCRQSTRGRP